MYIGTHYEYLVSSTLAKYGFTLRRTGGRLDGGIDLIGTWTVPSAPQPLKVLIQCKAGTKLMPSLIRELGGSIQGAPVGWRGSQVLALLATMTPATAGVREALSRSEQPMGFILCSKTGVLQQFLWNGRAEAEGLHGIGVSLRRVPESQELTQLALTFHGKPLPSSSA